MIFLLLASLLCPPDVREIKPDYVTYEWLQEIMPSAEVLGNKPFTGSFKPFSYKLLIEILGESL
jgi:hypothetical protein